MIELGCAIVIYLADRPQFQQQGQMLYKNLPSAAATTVSCLRPCALKATLAALTDLAPVSSKNWQRSTGHMPLKPILGRHADLNDYFRQE